MDSLTLHDLFPWIFLAVGLFLILRGGRRSQEWNRYLQRATEHLETAEAHMQRVEEKLDRLIALQEREK